MSRVDRRGPGFTLIELLVTVSVIALLIALVLPGLRMAIGSARSFKCQMGQRATAFDFSIFADGDLHGDRGDDAGRVDFAMETFQENQYGVDEFWRWGDIDTVALPDAEGNDPMRCPEVKSPLVLARNVPCSNGAVGPAESVSYAFNLRLHRGQVIDSRGRPRAKAVRLRESILEAGSVPLLFDANGEQAAANGVSAVYAGPSLDDDIFGQDQFWFPANRHNRGGNYAFVDGHVSSSRAPLEETDWRWEFSPVR